jgi:DNA-binding response OmpR family regulator
MNRLLPKLMARIKAVLRRAQKDKDGEVESSALLRGPGKLLMTPLQKGQTYREEAKPTENFGIFSIFWG